MKLSKIVAEMKKREEELPIYNKELSENKRIEVRKVDEILKYLLRIANYPMKPANGCSFADYILKMLDKSKANPLF